MPKAKKPVKKPVKKAKKLPVKAVKKTSKKVVKVARKEDAPVAAKPQVAAYPETTQRVELWAYDEYNQGSIVASGDIKTVVARAKRFVTEQNVDNALSATEKNNAWEAFFPVFFSGDQIDYTTLYAGNKRQGKHEIYSYADGKWNRADAPTAAKVRFYLGELYNGKVRSDWYLADHLNREITSLSNQALERKTVLFIKIV